MKTQIDKPVLATTIFAAIIYAFIAFWIFCLLTASAHAGVITNAQGFYVITNPVAKVGLAWNASTDPSVNNYNLYMGGVSGGYTNEVALGNVTNTTVTLPARGVKFFFSVTATVPSGLESQFSNEINYTASNLPPVVTMSPPVTLVVQHSQQVTGPFSDTEMAWSVDPATSTNDFFRLRIVAVAPQPQTQALPLVVPRATTPPPIPGQ